MKAEKSGTEREILWGRGDGPKGQPNAVHSCNRNPNSSQRHRPGDPASATQDSRKRWGKYRKQQSAKNKRKIQQAHAGLGYSAIITASLQPTAKGLRTCQNGATEGLPDIYTMISEVTGSCDGAGLDGGIQRASLARPPRDIRRDQIRALAW